MDNNDHVLLVEGQHDEHVISHLWCSHNSYQEDLPFKVLDKKGYSSLLESISLEANVSGRKILGIIIDANDSLNARWDAMVEEFEREGIELPRSPKETGTIIPGTVRNPRIGMAEIEALH